jgi:hypothetical protein
VVGGDADHVLENKLQQVKDETNDIVGALRLAEDRLFNCLLVHRGIDKVRLSKKLVVR